MTTTSSKLCFLALAAFMTQIKVNVLASTMLEGGSVLGTEEGPMVHEVLMKNAQHLPNEIITEPLSGP